MSKENLIKRILHKWTEWTYQKWIMLVIFIVILSLYSVLHEYIHYWTNMWLGHSGNISWGLFGHHFTLDSLRISFNQYFLIAIAPYIVNIVLLIFIFSLYSFFPKYKAIFAKIAIFPFLDLIWNYLVMVPAYFTQAPNDFLNLIKVGAIQGNDVFIWIVVFIILLISIGIFLFNPFISTIWNMLKLDRKSL